MSSNDALHSTVLVPVDVDHIDQLVLVARDLAGFVLILDAAAAGDPTFAAIERVLVPINKNIQDFKAWLHDAWHVAAGRGTTRE